MNSKAAKRDFELLGGHVALDLVNTLDFRFRDSGALELITSYDDLLGFASQAGMVSEERARKLSRAVSKAEAAAALEQARQLREALAHVLYSLLEARAPGSVDLGILESQFHQAAVHRRLAADKDGLSWSWAGAKKDAAFPVWVLAQAANEFLASDLVARLRACDCDTCRWLFLDTSKNHSRRWCDMKICGNRTKARKYQARQYQARQYQSRRQAESAEAAS